MRNLDVLFSSYQLKALNLPNRVVMAPMTRSFAPGGVPTAEVAAYYRRRAENGVGRGSPPTTPRPDIGRYQSLGFKVRRSLEKIRSLNSGKK
jgi:2,4-dienoyl-CoA reductase-like NADH-dependent reductase (Old Yellow Enzyme family)